MTLPSPIRPRLQALALVLLGVSTGCPKPQSCDLCDAVQARDVARVRTSIPSPPVDDRTIALGMALRGWEPGFDPELVSALLDGGANPNSTAPFKTIGRSEAYFLELAVDTDADIVKRLIDKGADVKGRPGSFALLKAAGAGRRRPCASSSTRARRSRSSGRARRRSWWPNGTAGAEVVRLLRERGATR